MIFILILLIFSLPLHATKPCPLDSWGSNTHLSKEDWIKKSKWAFKGVIVSMERKGSPAHNCYLKDKSKCTLVYNGYIRLRVDERMAGEYPGGNLKLGPAYCARELPERTSGEFLFFGDYPISKDGEASYKGFFQLK